MAEEVQQTPPTQQFESLSVAASSSSTPEMMSPEERFRIVRSIGEECIQDEELLKLFKDKPHPICYDGFEPSGRMHIAQGVMKAINVNKLTSAGCHVKILIADWFAQLNNKMGGDLPKIRLLGEYFIEIWKALGMNIEAGNIEFLWSSDEINSRASEYWPLVLDIARRNNLPRIMRCCQIMGRKESDGLTAAQIFYPCMQCADVFFLKADICQLGKDQRKVNVLAREYCDDSKRKKPIILSHHMLPGLQEGQDKMSKSDTTSSIFMEDEEAKVIEKINTAYCPPKIVEGNPCLEYIKYLIFPWFNEFKVERKPENGGEKTFHNFADLVAEYENEGLHPADLKPALSKSLNMILQPVRDHFKNDSKAADLFKRVKLLVQHVTKQTPPTQQLESLSVAASSSSTLEVSQEEWFQDEELLNLLKRKPNSICYDGFEPSGRMHIAQGVMKAINVNKLISAGCHFKIWIADWFAQMNNKMGGDLAKIRDVGEYMIEIWKALGMNIEAGNIEFLWSSDEINSRASEYWPLVLDIARRNDLPRIMRCCQIMGREESDELTAAQIFYPCMQCADLFLLKADICQMGMDQREVNDLAREYCDDIKRESKPIIKRENKPIILSHHMLPGLQQGQEKMSTSDDTSCIFMDDEEAAVIKKIRKAYCPPKIVEGNPCMEYIKYIIFPWFNEFKVERKPENGGEKTFLTFAELVLEYENEGLHPADLKPALSKALNKILQPVRDHFKNDAKAADLLKRASDHFKNDAKAKDLSKRVKKKQSD